MPLLQIILIQLGMTDLYRIVLSGFAVVGVVFIVAVVVDCCVRRDWKLLTIFIIAVTLFLIAVQL